MKTLLFAARLGLLLLLAIPALAEPVKDGQVEVELLAGHLKLAPGDETWLAIRIKADEEWHTYWKNPGDTGLPTTVEWTLPPGYEVGELQWPYPERYQSEGLVSFVYEREEFVLSRLKVPDSATPGEVDLSARVEWLACKEACIPGSAELSLKLEIAEQPLEGPSLSAIQGALSRLPQPALEGLAASWDGQAIALQADWELGEVEKLWFVPIQELIIENGAEQLFEVNSGKLGIQLTPAAVNPVKPDRLEGVLIVDSAEGTQSFLVDVEVESKESL